MFLSFLAPGDGCYTLTPAMLGADVFSNLEVSAAGGLEARVPAEH